MKFYLYISLFTLSLTQLSWGVPVNTTPLCSLVDEPINMGQRVEGIENPYDNGYKKERYHQVLDTVIETFNPEFMQRGEELKILRDWSDGAVNAWAFRIGKESWLEVPGGMSRYHLISEEGFLMTICHELGHLLGGAPHRNQISFEGQADYYAPMKCMEKILSALNSSPSKGLRKNALCVGKFCKQRFEGIRSLTSYYAFLEKVPAPRASSPSQVRVRQTLRSHPPAQCRFDTMLSALGCNNRDSFSYTDPGKGACDSNLARPACWFKAEL